MHSLAYLALSVLLGLIFGSFSSMASYRIPRGKNLAAGRSRCPKCDHALGVLDLFPVLSWLISGGKCRYCGSKVAFRYILHEVALGALFGLFYWLYGVSALTLILWGMALCLVIIIAIDLEHYFIPDTMQLPLFIFGLSYAAISFPTFLEPFLALVVFASLGFALRIIGYAMKGVEALGWGDVKFFGTAGLFLGFDLLHIAVFFMVAGLAGIVTALVWRHTGRGKFFPFGPGLAAGLVASMCVN